jgi:hypothetical protein
MEQPEASIKSTPKRQKKREKYFRKILTQAQQNQQLTVT